MLKLSSSCLSRVKVKKVEVTSNSEFSNRTTNQGIEMKSDKALFVRYHNRGIFIGQNCIKKFSGRKMLELQWQYPMENATGTATR